MVLSIEACGLRTVSRVLFGQLRWLLPIARMLKLDVEQRRHGHCEFPALRRACREGQARVRHLGLLMLRATHVWAVDGELQPSAHVPQRILLARSVHLAFLVPMQSAMGAEGCTQQIVSDAPRGGRCLLAMLQLLIWTFDAWALCKRRSLRRRSWASAHPSPRARGSSKGPAKGGAGVEQGFDSGGG